MRTRGITELLLVSLLTFGACGGEEASDAAPEGAAEDSAAPSGLESTANAASNADATVAIAEMRSHLNVITAAGGDEMVAMVPQHRERVESLITRLSGPNVTANAAWTPTVDSVRQDLSRMPGMPANELEALVEGNAERVRRLMEMYERGR